MESVAAALAVEFGSVQLVEVEEFAIAALQERVQSVAAVVVEFVIWRLAEVSAAVVTAFADSSEQLLAVVGSSVIVAAMVSAIEEPTWSSAVELSVVEPCELVVVAVPAGVHK